VQDDCSAVALGWQSYDPWQVELKDHFEVTMRYQRAKWLVLDVWDDSEGDVSSL